MTFDEAYPYSVSRSLINDTTQYSDIWDWCCENIGSPGLKKENFRMRYTVDGEWVVLVDSFRFKREKDAFLFKLTFAG